MIMSTLEVHLRRAREARGWSQHALAVRAGVSRAEISAIETGRLVPSTSVALALAGALGGRVEDLFSLTSASEAWAWTPRGRGGRFWLAEVSGRILRYPGEATALGTLAHDGTTDAADGPRAGSASTLVLAGCDPAVGILAAPLHRMGVRLLPFTRSSGRALELLGAGRVHVAGLHLADSSESNAALARARLGPGYRVMHLTRWTEGLALAPGLEVGTPAAAVRGGLRWVGREEGSGARQCLDALWDGWEPREGAARMAADHGGVVEAIRAGWAQAGVCEQLAAEEAGLDFLPLRAESYDLCFCEDLEADPRLKALLETVRSQAFRRVASELPGHDARRAGALA